MHNGRFISDDPIGFNGGDVNLYAYVGNNPILLVDPYGLWGPPGAFIGLIQCGIGGAIMGFAAGASSGTWEGAVLGALGGAISGGIVGAVVGFVNPFSSGVAGAVVGGMIGAIPGDMLSPADLDTESVPKPKPEPVLKPLPSMPTKGTQK